jgi:hypothetical protein
MVTMVVVLVLVAGALVAGEIVLPADGVDPSVGVVIATVPASPTDPAPPDTNPVGLR